MKALYISFAVIFVVFLFGFQPQNVKAADWLSGYSYRQEITISNINAASDLSYFPLLVASTSNSAIGAGVVNKTTGYDIRFTSSDGSTPLPYERESFSVTDDIASYNFWVRVPVISSATPTTIYVYYGNVGVSANDWTAQSSTIANCTTITNAQCVWKEGASQNYLTVYHLAETGSGSASDYKDSTSNANNAGQTTNEPSYSASGIIGGSQSFNGTSQYINMGDKDVYTFTSNFTVSLWYKLNSITARSTLISKGAASGAREWQITTGNNVADNYRILGLIGNSSGTWSSQMTTSDLPVANEWVHTSLVRNGSSGVIYNNGVSTYSNTISTTYLNTITPVSLGRSGSASEYTKGFIDEVRISLYPRTAAWVKFEYCNALGSAVGTCTGNNELTLGAQESAPTGFVVNEISPITTPTNDSTPTYTFSSTEAGSITYGGDCSSATSQAVSGNNSIEFNTLAEGTYSNCTIYVTDISANQSNTLLISPFTVDTTAPTISSVTTINTSGTYGTDEEIPITINFSEAVTSSGDVTVTFNTTPARSCTFAITSSASGSCTYTIQSGDSATGLDVEISGTILDAANNSLTNFVPSNNLSASKSINIDNLTAPVDLTQPIQLIVDTDIASDWDDAYAVAEAHALAQRGLANILAIVTNVNNIYAAPTVRVLNSWWGKSIEDIPIGAYQGSAETRSSLFAQSITNLFGISGDTRANYPSALTVYRQTLADAEDNSVVIASIGFLQNLSTLLQSPADDISPLTGLELVTQKVKRLAVMGGEYPSGSEHNFTYDAGSRVAAAYVMSNWPTEIVATGYSFGVSVLTEPSESRDINTDPLAKIWDLTAGEGVAHSSWDPLTVYYAVMGLSSNFTADGISGINAVNTTTGSNSWSSPGLGNVTYLGKAITNSALATKLNLIVDTTPIIISSVSSGVPSTTGATITWVTNGTETVSGGNWVSTDILTTSEVEYGLTAAYTASTTDSDTVSSHSVELSGLTPNTLYHYRVKSTYSDGSYAVSGDQTFTTASVTASDHTITAFAGQNGSITPSGNVSVSDGGNQIFTFTPNKNFEISEVKVDGVSVSTDSTYQFSGVSSNHSIEVTFMPIPKGGGRCKNCHVLAPAQVINLPTESIINTEQSKSELTGKITMSLRFGQTSDDIILLQKFLNSDKDTQVALNGAGSPGKETNYFGLLTLNAVIRFQNKYASDILTPWSLKSGTGFVGKTTLKKINEIISRL